MNLEVARIAAFSDGATGGNPAGVVLASQMPDAATMQQLAHEIGFSETAFASPVIDGWRVRYFSPESEVPFCGHATIALGALLAMREGDGTFPLHLNEADIVVEGARKGELFFAALQSPPTRSVPLSASEIAETLALFNYDSTDLDERLAPSRIHGGADHLVIALRSRAALARMKYEFEHGRALMDQKKLITILLVYAETQQVFHSRNAFASGGVYEDPATGASTAAFAGYLRDVAWPHGGHIDIVQGEDMGMKSLLRAEIPDAAGSSIRVSGSARVLEK